MLSYHSELGKSVQSWIIAVIIYLYKCICIPSIE